MLFGEVQKRAIEAGLVMSRDRDTMLINLRRRDSLDRPHDWQKLTLLEAVKIVSCEESLVQLS